MAEVNSSIEVGAAQSFGASYAPRRTNITTSTGNWNYGYGSYPAPYRSFSQNLVNANWILGPYCRRLDGVAGRLRISMQAAFGEIGFVQQCWYDFPRGSNDKINGVLQESNKVWWDTEVSRKYWIRVYNLNDDNAPLIWVQVAIDGGGGTNPPLSMHDPSNGPLQGKCIQHIRAGHNMHGGQVNPAQLYTGIAGNCGIKSNTFDALAIPATPTRSGWIPDVSFLENGGFSGCPYLFDPNGELNESIGRTYNSLSGSEQSAVGSDLNDTNRDTYLQNQLNTILNNIGDFLDNLKGSLYVKAALNEAGRQGWLDDAFELLEAIPLAASLMLDGWWVPNIRQVDPNPFNAPTGTADNPHILRPPTPIAVRWASQMYANADGSPKPYHAQTNSGHIKSNGTGVNYGDSRDYIPHITPTQSDGTKDWAWFLTHLNRGDTTTKPWVDSNTNEYVWNENYGFGRGGSVQSADPIINWVDANLGTNPDSNGHTSLGNSYGALLDMSPANSFFIATLVPILLLEGVGRMIKAERGQSINHLGSNLDGYVTTTFETRISAKDIKTGNPAMYNYLLNTGLPDKDGNIQKFTAVP